MYGINVGNFLTALLTFVLTALVLYFAVVVPYNRLSAIRKKDEPEKAASTDDLLAEIRDLLRARNSDSGARVRVPVVRRTVGHQPSLLG